MDNLEKGLFTFINEPELTSPLAVVLDYTRTAGKISYDKTREITGENADEILLLGNSWRLLLPVRMAKSGAWEDLLLICQPGEFYVMPNIVRHLVQHAGLTGAWDTMQAIASVFKEIEEADWQKMSAMLMELGEHATNNQVSGNQIKEVCIKHSLGAKVDTIIAELKATGIMSPKLAPLAEISKAGSPMYELNPSVFTKKL